LSAALPLFRGHIDARTGEALTTDLAILNLLEGDTEGAAAGIQGGLYEARGPGGLSETSAPSPDFLRFAAEYFYDFGDPLRAAELFSRLGTEMDIIRQADALWLSGRPENARNIWALLVSPAGGHQAAAGSVPPALAARVLYNLALTAADNREAAALLEQLIALPSAAPGIAGSGAVPGADIVHGIIRYSRLLDTPQSLTLLERSIKEFPRNPLLDLEVLRRRSGPAGYGETWETGRVVGETWLLLCRYSEQEELYQWGAWYFDYQRQWAETARLLKTAERYQFNGPWIRFHAALGSITGGDLSRAEELLLAIPAADWPVFANLGRILEARLAPAPALEYYELAASLAPNREEAARIQLRIARCLKSLGRDEESRRVLEYALDLNPDNLNARLELRRLDNPEH
jgi:tetratricopeptide (TPR) repeat protein